VTTLGSFSDGGSGGAGLAQPAIIAARSAQERPKQRPAVPGYLLTASGYLLAAPGRDRLTLFSARCIQPKASIAAYRLNMRPDFCRKSKGLGCPYFLLDDWISERLWTSMK
jgi:hypothetical protein